jgi:hypothetical protein
VTTDLHAIADLIREALELAQSGTQGRLVPARSGTETHAEALAYVDRAIAAHERCDLALIVTEPDPATGAQKLIAICGNGPQGTENARALAAARTLQPAVLSLLADVWSAMEHIAQGGAYDPQAFAAAVVGGATSDRAIAADLASLESPGETDPEYLRTWRAVEARRELERAALAWESSLGGPDYAAAADGLLAACLDFRKVTEVEG